ncbi:hypothetical protein HYH03_017051 [Edaphochlamys debaryana]|uniref:Uncharacterized protein n=1 Tax=Edaphochlamys debaryana TaxID=47281 RepID=A0A835XQ37_9CHLO|nr:hypothetical protein HYH03_017051 [Edaphochlamys debaryana]|eukprot:KAG2484099.1 hypothetical protein HYH03_017051 [Edaphochlamys debaryana]
MHAAGLYEVTRTDNATGLSYTYVLISSQSGVTSYQGAKAGCPNRPGYVGRRGILSPFVPGVSIPESPTLALDAAVVAELCTGCSCWVDSPRASTVDGYCFLVAPDGLLDQQAECNTLRSYVCKYEAPRARPPSPPSAPLPPDFRR